MFNEDCTKCAARSVCNEQYKEGGSECLRTKGRIDGALSNSETLLTIIRLITQESSNRPDANLIKQLRIEAKRLKIIQ